MSFIYWPKIEHSKTHISGVTLIELLVVIGLLAVFFSLSVINITQLIPKSHLSTTVDVLIADLKQQQQKAMSGETGTASASGEAQPHGVHIDANQYVLYSGIVYDEMSSSNSAFPLSQPVLLSSTFVANDILFNKGSGEISGYTSSESARITVTDTVQNRQKVIQLNQLGVVVGVD